MLDTDERRAVPALLRQKQFGIFGIATILGIQMQQLVEARNGRNNEASKCKPLHDIDQARSLP
jgi:hypothetical protein